MNRSYIPKHLLTVLAASALFASAPINAATAKKKAVNPDAALIAEAKKATLALLRDPQSAQFRNVRVVLTPIGSKKICGEVNSKNAYGGYAGFSRFVYYGRAALESAGGPTERDFWIFAIGC